MDYDDLAMATTLMDYDTTSPNTGSVVRSVT